MTTKQEACSQIRIMIMEASSYHALHELYHKLGIPVMATQCLIQRDLLGITIRTLAKDYGITLKEV